MQSICNKPILLTSKICDSTARIAGKSSRTIATYHLKKPIKQLKTDECFLSQKLGGGAGIGHPHREFLRATESVAAPTVKNVLLVDARVENCDSLARGATADTFVFVLDSTRDGVEQITRILANYSDLDSLQIVSHGREARVQLGSIELWCDNLETYSHLLQQWGKALSERGHILLFGCSVAAGESGAAFVRRLSFIAGADIAASDNLTGSAALGGDWELKFATGEIKASIAIEKEVLEAYTYALGTKETFKNSTVRGPGIYGGNEGALLKLNPSNGAPPANQRIPGITGGTVSGRIPALGGSSPGDGGLRLTKAADDPEAFVIYNPITSTDGLRVRFDFYSDGSSEQYNAQGSSISPQPGDDLGFFLIDGTASPERTGGYGGSLAYAPRTGMPGMEGGDLGLELDEFGNFSTSTEGPGGQKPPRIPGSSIGSFRPDSVIAPATRSGISNTARSSSATFDRLATNHNGSPTNKDGTPTNSTVTTSIAPNADLATTQTGSTSAIPGSSLSYTIAPGNLGPSPAEAVIITDSIVPGLTRVTASNGGVYEPATGIVPEGPVAIARETVTRTRGFTVPPTLTSIRNRARSTSIAPDSTPANNNGTNPNATATTSIDAVADIVTQKTAPASINAGDTLLYTITTTNNGPSPAANAVIIDSLIPGLTCHRARRRNLKSSQRGDRFRSDRDFSQRHQPEPHHQLCTAAYPDRI
ncbi:DUF4347 domain-containing protein [Microcoleus sp.]|uniref:DUF4347 domain-containing protein n=1 Tax=Microcoleus sp. TaxID=44472 RepID=UPI00403E7CCB